MIVSKTPLRISFVGGGSDIRQYYASRPGAVLSSTIDKYIYVTVNRRFEGNIHVGYSKAEWVNRVEDIQHDIIREAIKLTGIKGGLDITYVSDLPIINMGTGLGASSAIAVGTLNALYALKGESANPAMLAEEACKIEIELLKQPIGKQDQYAAAYGGMNSIRFNPNESASMQHIELSAEKISGLEKRLHLFYTGLPSDSKTVLAEQVARTASNFEILDKMVEFVPKLDSALKGGQYPVIGELLHQNWLLKRTLASKVSNSMIDEYYEAGLAAGATGGKILGSGGGGFLLFYCEPERAASLEYALRGLKKLPFKFTNEGSKIVHL